MHEYVAEAAPDVQLVEPVPFVAEISFESLLFQLCEIIDSWIYQTDNHGNKAASVGVTFAFFINVNIKQIYKNGEYDQINCVTEQSEFVDLTCVCEPLELN